MTHADAAERARAHLAFIQARRHMLDAMRGWLALGARPDIAQDEADGTCSAVRQIVALVGYTQGNGCMPAATVVLEASRDRSGAANATRPLTKQAFTEPSNG